MRNFGNLNYSGWYKPKTTSHSRYFDFLTRLKNAFDARGLYRKRDAVSSMRQKIAAGKSPKDAQKASKTSGYSPPLFSDFNSLWEESQNTDAIVDYFADGGEAPSGSSGPSIEEMVSTMQSSGPSIQSMVEVARQTLPDGEITSTSVMEEEDEGFLSQYKVPIVVGSAFALAGGAFYFFVMRD
jgi:hypothetical protein